jgi:hypothetical protein
MGTSFGALPQIAKEFHGLGSTTHSRVVGASVEQPNLWKQAAMAEFLMETAGECAHDPLGPAEGNKGYRCLRRTNLSAKGGCDALRTCERVIRSRSAFWRYAIVFQLDKICNRSHFIDGFSALRFVATVGRLENCGVKTVDVHYIVYTAIIPPFGKAPLERQQAEFERPATTGARLGTAGRFLLVPDFGYNHTRRGYGGGTLQSQVPFGLFDHLEVGTAGSSDSLVTNVALTGTHTPGFQLLSRADWSISSSYYEVPAGSQDLKEASVAMKFFGATKNLTDNMLLVHYGASVAGGHQQGVLQDAPDSSYGDLKLLTGVEGQKGRNAFGLSYGIHEIGDSVLYHSKP